MGAVRESKLSVASLEVIERRLLNLNFKLVWFTNEFSVA